MPLQQGEGAPRCAYELAPVDAVTIHHYTLTQADWIWIMVVCAVAFVFWESRPRGEDEQDQ